MVVIFFVFRLKMLYYSLVICCCLTISSWRIFARLCLSFSYNFCINTILCNYIFIYTKYFNFCLKLCLFSVTFYVVKYFSKCFLKIEIIIWILYISFHNFVFVKVTKICSATLHSYFRPRSSFSNIPKCTVNQGR